MSKMYNTLNGKYEDRFKVLDEQMTEFQLALHSIDYGFWSRQKLKILKMYYSLQFDCLCNCHFLPNINCTCCKNSYLKYKRFNER